MTREQYIQTRKTNSLNIKVFYEYYVSKCKKAALPFQIFSQTFPMFLNINSEQVFKKLDNEFEVTLLQDKEGNIVDVY